METWSTLALQAKKKICFELQYEQLLLKRMLLGLDTFLITNVKFCGYLHKEMLKSILIMEMLKFINNGRFNGEIKKIYGRD